MFSTHYGNVFGEMEYSMYRASTVNYVGHFKSKASSFIPFLDTVIVSHNLTQGMVLDQRLEYHPKKNIYLYTYFF